MHTHYIHTDLSNNVESAGLKMVERREGTKAGMGRGKAFVYVSAGRGSVGMCMSTPFTSSGILHVRW